MAKTIYTIVELLKTTCCLTNALGKILKTRINLSQLKPYLSPLEHKHIESEDGLADQSGDDDELSSQDESTNPTQGTAEKEPSQPDEKTAETETDEATAEKEPSQTRKQPRQRQMRQQLRKSQASQMRKQLRQSCLIQLHQIQKKGNAPTKVSLLISI